MKTLVTGGAGFIGSNLVEALVRDRCEVVVMDNIHSGNVKNLGNLDVDIIQNSVGDIDASLDVSAIFHLGMPSSSPMYKKDPKLVGQVINDAIALFEFARQKNCKVVFASSSSLYNGLAPPHRENMAIKVTDYYTEARLGVERIAELYNKLYGVRSAAMRFFSVYGKNETAKGEYANIITQFLWKMKNNEAPLIFGDGSQTRDFTYVDDVVSACRIAMDKTTGFDIFNVGTGRMTSFNEVVNILNRVLGKKIKPQYKQNPIKNYVADTQADTTKAKKILGFEAKTTLEEGAKKLLEFY